MRESEQAEVGVRPDVVFVVVDRERNTLLLFPLSRFCPYGVIAEREKPSTEENEGTGVVYAGRGCFLDQLLVGRGGGHGLRAGVGRSDGGKSCKGKSVYGLRVESAGVCIVRENVCTL